MIITNNNTFAYVRALAADGAGHLFVGGSFTQAGTNVCPYIAQADVGPTAPFITRAPTNQNTLVGGEADFSVVARGALPMGYQWFFGTGAILGATDSALQLTNVHTWQAGSYTVLVTNAYGAATSAPAVLTVLQPIPPAIVTGPSSQAVWIGATVDFSVAATGSPPLNYYWLFNATNAQGTGPSLHLTDVRLAQAGAYTVIVSNLGGAVTSAPAWLTVTGVPPVIVSSPTNQNSFIGAEADFSLVAWGTLPLGYQWFFGTDALPGATEFTLQLINVQPWQAGVYTAVVTNAYGAMTSAPAVLQVFPRTVLTASEAALRAAMAGGGTVTFACDGTITLANTLTITLDTVLDATGHQVTTSGGNAVRVFSVGAGATLTLLNLTIANGQATSGAAILNSGTVNATNCTFSGNMAATPAGDATAAPSTTTGTLRGSDCAFVRNTAFVGGVAPLGSDWRGRPGAAICSVGNMVIQRSLLASNTVVGGTGGVVRTAGLGLVAGFPPWRDPAATGATACGGAVFASGPSSLVNCTLTGNQACGRRWR